MGTHKRLSPRTAINISKAVREILSISADESVFISGPMTGYKNFNRAAFAEIEELLKFVCKCTVFNPGRREDGHEYEWYMARCAEDVRQCTTVVFLPGWFNSPGARREFALARSLNKKIIFLTE